ncbi:pyridine nucleotide-disulfide oxidoreductase [Solihabitans fulvus]|uniref:Pyridine nucleotide-disulfide oxidoreductase n=1 Tax=Solihabitans fulvus TaxID=1892852 RepID=A0A5B2X2V7_9PSEU|nr:FAD-dependent oxidoreductase [Solihabitans fulvus]KAA2257558.1 pyridine nucleotide-disulfide oxidoreductase [Solihabitans fulvus]
MTERARIVVVGAGYAGVMAANRIAARSRDVEVTVVNPRPEFVERIRLHQYVAGTARAVVPLAGVLRREVRLRVATVDVIAERSIRLADGEVLEFDHLVYAVGSRSGRRMGGGANAVGDLGAAHQLRERVLALPQGARVVVVGGGLTGVETSAELAERFPALRVELVSPMVAPSLPSHTRARVERTLTRLGVAIRAATATSVHADRVDTDGGVLSSDCTIWAGPFEVPDLALRSGLPVDEQGRLRTDETLACVGHPRIVGVGDAVAPPTSVAGHLRMSCQAAIPLGAHGADTVLALIRGEEPTPLSIGLVGQAVGLGRRAAIIQAARADDSPRGAVLSGRPAALVKELVCRSTVLSIKSMPAAYRWSSGPTPTRVDREEAAVR